MKTIHILGAGGPAGVGMTRCLRDYYRIIGSDDSLWGKLMKEAEPIDGIYEHDMTIPVPDSTIASWKGWPKVFLPAYKQIILCQDKAKTAQVLGNLAPRTYWVRDTTGAGGKGAHMAAEYLPGRNCSVELVYKDGVLLANFQKQRLSYLVSVTEPDVTKSGSSAVSICIQDADLLSRATEAIDILTATTGSRADGFYGVDFKATEAGVPLITEINAGRLLTASYSYFWLTGWNLPLVGVRAFLGEQAPEMPEYPLGYGIIRQIDQEPRLFTPSQTESWPR